MFTEWTFMVILYAGKYSLPYYFCSVRPRFSGRIKDWTNSNVLYYISLNTAFLGEFKMGRNRLQLKKGGNNMGRK